MRGFQTRPEQSHRDALARAVHESGLDAALITIQTLVKIADQAGIIPPEVEDEALWLAKSQWVRKAAADHDPDDVPDLFNIRVTEATAQGEEIVIQGYKTPDALNMEEWDQVVETYKVAAENKRALYIRILKLRNDYARRHGWPLLPVPRK
jgi:hypothetical protein